MAKPKGEEEARDQKMAQWKSVPGGQGYYAKIYQFQDSRWPGQLMPCVITTPEAIEDPELFLQDDITAGPGGHLWCCEFKGNRIGWITPDGRAIQEFDLPTPIARPVSSRSAPTGTSGSASNSATGLGEF